MYNPAVDLNLLETSLIATRIGGRSGRTSLPGVLAALTADRIEEFPALRPHQSAAWHAFLVQLAVVALRRARQNDLPRDAAAWAELLRGLTEAFPDDAPWCLVAPPDRPALFQPPVPGGDLADFRHRVESADALDMLVTSRNHDLKAARMRAAAPEDWLFALVSLQTQEGFMGRGNYGISRMNGGFSSRPALGVAPPGGPGARFRRDVEVLLRAYGQAFGERGYRIDGSGKALLWLEPWDGREQLAMSELDPLYIEVCRRVRLVAAENDGLAALLANSERTRLAAAGGSGNTGDPWTPVGAETQAALSLTGEGFSYRRLSDLLFGDRWHRALLQTPQPEDGEAGLVLSAAAIARGQGKTEGYHRRRIPIPPDAAVAFRTAPDEVAAIARERVEQVGQMAQRVLKPALFALLQDGPDQVNFRHAPSETQARPWLTRFDRQVDRSFFERLWAEVAAAPSEQGALRQAWLQDLKELAGGVLEQAAEAAPSASMRRYRARVRAESYFYGRHRHEFRDLYPNGGAESATQNEEVPHDGQ